jgi:hypothetical protein
VKKSMKNLMKNLMKKLDEKNWWKNWWKFGEENWWRKLMIKFDEKIWWRLMKNWWKIRVKKDREEKGYKGESCIKLANDWDWIFQSNNRIGESFNEENQ